MEKSQLGPSRENLLTTTLNPGRYQPKDVPIEVFEWQVKLIGEINAGYSM